MHLVRGKLTHTNFISTLRPPDLSKRTAGRRGHGPGHPLIALLLTLFGAGLMPVASANAAGSATFPETPAPLQITRNLTMQQAARAGILKLTPKGGFEGDDVKAELEGKNVSAPITVSLHVEFALAEGHSAKSNEILRDEALPQLEQKTEKELNKRHYKTSRGEPITFELDFKFRGPGQPPTPGYDQVTVINPNTDLPEPNPDQRAYVEGLGVPNTEMVIGAVFPNGDLTPQILAHEMLHFIGLDDQYTDVYVYKGREIPLPEKGMSPKDLAEYLGTLKPPVPNPSTKNVKAKNDPGVGRCDIMGTGDESPCAKISKKDLKWIESQAGVQVEAKPGELLLNKSADLQNLAVDYPTRIIAPRGGTTVAPGISAYCVDHTKGAPGIGGPEFGPSASEGFDVGPALASLPGFSGVVGLLDLNSEVEASLSEPVKGMQQAIWNITDGASLEDESEPPEFEAAARSLLARAGIPENSAPGGLEHPGDPNAAAPTTGAVDPTGAIMPPIPAEEVAPPPPISADTVILVPDKAEPGRAVSAFLVLGVGGEVSGVALELQRRKGHSWKSVKSLPGHSLDSGDTELPLNLGRLKAGRYRVQVTLSGPVGAPVVKAAPLTVRG